MADDPLCACGLLLLARAVEAIALVELLTDEILAASPREATVRAVIAAVTSEAVRRAPAVDHESPEDIAAALLSSRIDQNIGKCAFPGAPSDLEGHLVALVARGSYAPSADFGAMVVLAALEAIHPLPKDDLPTPDGPCDIGIVVALKEEFRILFECIRDRHTYVEDGDRSYYIFDVPTLTGSGSYRCVATLVGDMGTNRTGIIAEKLLGRWKPAAVGIIGIAAGVHDDVKLGDVIVASQVDNYLEGAKAVEEANATTFKRTSDSFKTSYVLLERARNFEFASRASHSKWQADAESRRASLGPDAAELTQEGLLRRCPELKEGHLASGPVVVASKTFLSWVRDGDRACLGIEMEAAGLMIATHMDPTKTDTLIIRGVSDFGDDRKAKLDRIGGGVLRRYAMENATALLWGLMETGVLPRRPPHSDQATSRG